VGGAGGAVAVSCCSVGSMPESVPFALSGAGSGSVSRLGVYPAEGAAVSLGAAVSPVAARGTGRFAEGRTATVRCRVFCRVFADCDLLVARVALDACSLAAGAEVSAGVTAKACPTVSGTAAARRSCSLEQLTTMASAANEIITLRMVPPGLGDSPSLLLGTGHFRVVAHRPAAAGLPSDVRAGTSCSM
jgi:hypothetical protein